VLWGRRDRGRYAQSCPGPGHQTLTIAAPLLGTSSPFVVGQFKSAQMPRLQRGSYINVT
jgi:hypothetical protein